MEYLVVENKKEGWHQMYRLSNIKKIEYGKASKFYNRTDIYRNNMRPGDPVIIIKFYDGEQATFSSNGDEEISFVREDTL